MEGIGRIFSEPEGRDDLLLLEDAIDPPYFRHAETEPAPTSPPFLSSRHPFSQPSPVLLKETLSSINFLSALYSSPPVSSHSSSTLVSSSSNLNLNSPLSSLSTSTSSSSNISFSIVSTDPSSGKKNNYSAPQLVFPTVSSLSPSTSSTSSTSTPIASSENFQATPTPSPSKTTAGGSNNCNSTSSSSSMTSSILSSVSSGTGGVSPEDGSKGTTMAEDLYAEAACEVCYKAKRSCDRRVPCGRCVRLSRTHLCIQRVRKTPRPRKLRESRPSNGNGSMSFLNKRPSEIQIGPSWIVDNQSKIPRLSHSHHIVQASIVPPQELKLGSSTSPGSSPDHHQHLNSSSLSTQFLQPPQPPPPRPTSPQHRYNVLSPHTHHSPSSQQSLHTSRTPLSHTPHMSPQLTTHSLTAAAGVPQQLQTMQQLLGIESIDWLSFLADLGESINGTLLPLVSLAATLDDENKKWSNPYGINPFSLMTHEEKWVTTWHDTVSAHRDALNQSGFLMKFDRVLCLSLLHLAKGSIHDLFISMFQFQERELLKNRGSSSFPLSSLPSTSSPSSIHSPSPMTTSLPSFPTPKLENQFQQLTQTLAGSSNNATEQMGEIFVVPLPVVVKPYVSNHCDLHATVILQWSRKEQKDGLPPHAALEIGSNKEMQRLFGYEPREVEADPRVFARLMHPKDWSTLLSKLCNAWIKGSTYMAMFATCISKRHIEFPCLLEFRSKVVKEEHALRVYCFFIPVPTTP